MEAPKNEQQLEHSYQENVEIVDYLKKSRLFGHLSGDILKMLVPLSEFVGYPIGHKILIIS